MARGKHTVKPAHAARRRPLALCLALLVLASASGTLAYIALKSDLLANLFAPAHVTCEVVVGSGTRAVKNTGDVDAFIRAAVTVNWVAEGDENTTRGIAPQADSDYTLTLNTGDDGNWIAHGDGYYYYKYIVAPEAVTDNLVQSIALAQGATAPTGYALAVEVAAEAIQADGDEDSDGMPAYRAAWGEEVPELPGGGAGS